MKKIFVTVILFCSAYCAFAESEKAKSVFSDIFTDVIFPNLDAVFDAYAGNWVGGQRVIVNGSELSKATISQRNIMTGMGDNRRLVSTGKISVVGGESMPTRSVMYMGKGRLVLEIRTADGRINTYVGFLELNSVKWAPQNFVMLYDYQIDSFYKTDKGILLASDSSRYVEVPQYDFKGYINVENRLEKDNPVFDKEMMNKSKMGIFNPTAE